MAAPPPSPVLVELATLDPEQDHQRITFLTLSQEFPWETQRALELALLRTFAVPSISRILVHSGEFEERPQKRYDDTEILISELIEHGYDSDRGQRAIKRINQLHARFEISNDDFRYVLSTFLLEPVRFIDRFGYRKVCYPEREALFHFWCAVGKRMNVQELPKSYEDFAALNVRYEAEHFRFSEPNQRVARATIRLLESWFPRPTRPVLKWIVYALLDANLRSACGFPHPPAALERAVARVLRARGAALRRLPKRQAPVLRSLLRRRTYPHGYELEKLGPAPNLEQKHPPRTRSRKRSS